MSDLQNDIIKYKKGELGSKEMHALEKKALSDPFLAEALEGIENISSKELSNDIEELDRKILKEKKTILFTPLRIAAGVILVTAAVFLFYELAPKRETLALKTEKQSGELQEEIEATVSQINFLREKVRYSTIKLEVYQTVEHQTAEVKTPALPKKFLRAFLSGLNGIMDVLIGLTYLWPFIAIGSIAGYVIWVRRKKKLLNVK